MTNFKLPGFESTFNMSAPILPDGNFTWAEALRNGERMPDSKAQVEQIMAIARRLQKIREICGNRPVKITSWLRPPAVNKAVGGASRSRHLFGDGVDFQVVGLGNRQVQELIRDYCREQNMGLGTHSRFTHVDLGGWRTWNYGGR